MNKLKTKQGRMALIVLVFAILIGAFSGCTGTTASSTSTSETTGTTGTTTTTQTTTTTTTAAPSETAAETEIPDLIRVASLKGPTGMGMAHLVNRGNNGELDLNYEFTFAGSPDELTAKLISGQLDIAALPTNLAAVLYQKTNQEVMLLAINTLGVLYVLEAGDTVQTFDDLAGKEILATGQGAVPEYALSYLLEQHGILDQTNVTFKAEHSELATLAAAGEADLVMLPEPFVTTVLSKRAEMRIALDLTDVWNKVQSDNGSEGELAMGCLVVTREFADNYPEAVESFLANYRESTEFANEQPKEAGELIAQLEILGSPQLAEKAIPNSYITMITGAEMKPVLEPLFETLLAANPQSVGGKLPDNGFYYGAND